jgi:hypothetical protein
VPTDAGWGRTESVHSSPPREGLIPLASARDPGVAPERPRGARRSALLIEILSFIVIAFLVSSALLFNLATPGKLVATGPGRAGQTPPMVPGLSDTRDVVAQAPPSDAPQHVAAEANPAATPGPPTEVAAALSNLEPASGSAGSENPAVSPAAPVADAAASPPTAEANAIASLPTGGPASGGEGMLPYGTSALPTESSPTVTAPESPPETSSLPVSPEATEALIRRGDDFLRTGDIVAARLSYERAAVAGGGAAARGVAKTYDPLFLAQAGVRGLRGDPARAALWYARAAAAGDREAQQRLRALRLQFPQ